MRFLFYRIMEKLITHEIEQKRNGMKIVRNFFINTDKTNYLTLAHSHFTKDERKQAKLNHKLNN